MALHEEIIRISLQGKENLTKILDNVDKSFKRFERDSSRPFAHLNTDIEDTRQNLAEFARDLEQAKGINKNRSQILALSRSYSALRKEIRGAAQDLAFEGAKVSRGFGGQFVSLKPEPQQPSTSKQLSTGFSQGLKDARETRNIINSALSQDKEAIAKRRSDAEFELREKQSELKREGDIRLTQAKAEIRLRRAALDEEITAIQKAKPTGFETTVAQMKNQFEAETKNITADIKRDFARQQNVLARDFGLNRRKEILSPPPTATVRDALNLRNEVDKGATAFERLGVKAGRATGDIARGFESGKTGLKKFEQETHAVETTMAKFGQALGNIQRNLVNLVKFKPLLIISAIQLLGNLVVQLGAALVALASSAALAGAALGGAFASGLLQAVAAGGLLRAAFSRVSAVLTAVKAADQAKQAGAANTVAAEKQQRTSAEQLADAHYALKQAIQAVVDATYQEHQASLGVTKAHQDEKDAVKNLAAARKQAARDIVDAVFAERDAALSLKEAELGVIQAKQNLINLEKSQLQSQADIKSAQEAVKEAQARLAQVRQQGDQQQILAAEQQLAVAQNAVSNLQTTAQTSKADVESAQVAVKRAQLSRDEAVVQNKRVQQDSEQTRKKGVAGSQQVIDAQKQLRDSIQNIAQAEHALADSERSRADAVHGVSIAQRNLRDTTIDAKNATAKAQGKDALAGLDPAEKRLAASVERIKALYKKNFGPITDIIINAISRAVDRSSVLLKDPKFLGAFRVLAEAIGKAFDKISKFTISPEFRKTIEFFATSAAKNIPKITDVFLNLLTAIFRIGKEATPIFDNLLGRFDRVTGRLKKFTDPAKTITNLGAGSDARDRPGQRVTTQSPLEHFLALADKHLNSWIRLGDAIGKVLVALGAGAQGTGLGFVDGLASALDRLARFLNTHREGVHKFFENLRNDLKGLGPLIGGFFTTFFKALSGNQGTAFAKVVLTVILPGLGLLLTAIGKVSRALLFLFNLPGVGKFVAIALQVAVAEKALNRIFPVTQRLTDAFQELAFHPKKSLQAIKEFAFGAEEVLGPGGAIEKKAKTGLIPALKNLGGSFASIFASTGKSTGKLKGFLSNSLGLVKDFSKQTGSKFKEFGTTLASSISTNTGKGLSKLKSFGTAAVNIVSGFTKQIITKIAAIDFAAIASSFGTALASMATAVFTFSKAVALAFVTPPLSIILLITAVISILAILELKFHIFERVFPIIKKIAGEAFKFLVEGFKLIGSAVSKWAEDTVNFAKRAAEGIINWFAKLPGRIFDIIKGIPGLIIKIFKGLGKLLIDGIYFEFVKLPELILKALKTLPDKIFDLFKGLGKKIADAIEGPIKKVANFFGIGGNESPEQIAKDALGGSGFAKEAIKTIFAKAAKGDKDAQKFISQIDPDTLKKLKGIEGHFGGGIGGKGGNIGSTDTVPAMLTPGEWVLNAGQQLKLATRLKTSVRDLSMALFGTHSNSAPELISEHGAGQNRINKVGKLGQSDPFAFPNVTLHPQTDADGNQIWFIEFGDRSWGQVTSNAAQRIISTKGGWIPGYALRASKLHRGLYGDPKLNTLAYLRQTVQNSGLLTDAHNRFALGGIVPAVQGFARGGPALNRPGKDGHTTKNINMTMQPIVQGDSDWSYVMRLAAVTAESAF